MAEDNGDKTETATPRKREEAREQGRVARSADLTAAAILLGFLLLMNSFGEGLIKALRTLLEEVLSAASFADMNTAAIGPMVMRCTLLVGGALAPMLLGAIIIAVIINIAQVGFFFTSERLRPNLGVLNPINGFGRLCKAENFVQLLMSVLKMALVTWVAWTAVRNRSQEIFGVQQLSYLQAFGLGAGIIYSIGLRIAILLLVLAILDYAWQRYKHEQELRMTKQEVKEEMRRMEGDPKIKQRRRQIAMQMAKKRLARDVPTADVIVTNPTHFAVALKYDSDKMHAPRVVAKGQDLLAQRIREIAAEHGIPIVERPPLARALYRMCEIGQEIPEQFYSMVAEILAYVYELTGKAKRRVTA